MKTSNKILLVFFLAFFFSAASLMLYAKSQLVIGENADDNFLYGKTVIEKTFIENLTTEHLEMGDNFRFSLDPNRTDVSIKGDSLFISKLKLADGDAFRILTGGVGNSFHWPENIFVTVGVKNLTTLKLDINGNAKVTGTDSMEYEKLELELNGNAKCELDINAQLLNVYSNGNGKLTVNGSADNLDVQANGNSKLYFEKSTFPAAKMELSGNAAFYGDTATDFIGNASGNALITFNEVSGARSTSTSGNARITIRK